MSKEKFNGFSQPTFYTPEEASQKKKAEEQTKRATEMHERKQDNSFLKKVRLDFLSDSSFNKAIKNMGVAAELRGEEGLTDTSDKYDFQEIFDVLDKTEKFENPIHEEEKMYNYLIEEIQKIDKERESAFSWEEKNGVREKIYKLMRMLKELLAPGTPEDTLYLIDEFDRMENQLTASPYFN